MPIRITGLNSGLDTESIISALVSSYSYKTNKYKKAQTKLSWKQDAWKTLNTKVYSFYTSLDSLRLSKNYNLKSTKVSDSTKATVTASSSAPNGTQKLNILRVAQAGYLTGGKLDDSTTTGTTLAELGYTGGNGSITLTKGDGTKKNIEVSQGTTVSSFINSLKEAGVNASYDDVNKRIFVSSKDTGKDNDFTLTGGNVDGATVLSKLGLNVQSKETDATYASYMQYYGDGTQSGITAKVNEALKAYQDAQKAYDKANAQNGNLSSTYGYASAYAAMKDAFAKSGLSEAEQDQMVKLVQMSATDRAQSVMDSNGNIYQTEKTNEDGSIIYSYTDASGNKSYIQSVTTDSETKYYTATAAEVKYTKITASDGKEYSEEENGLYVDSDGKKYFIEGSNLVETTGAKVNGSWEKTADGKTVAFEDAKKEEATKTVYTKGASEAAGVKSGTTAYTDLSQKAQNVMGLADEAMSSYLSSLASNVGTVKTYESTTDTGVQESDEYSRKSIIGKVHQAYTTAGTQGVTDLTNTFATVITANKETMKNSEATKEQHQVLSDIVAMEDGTEKDAAITAFVKQVQSAHDITTNASIEYNKDAKKIDGCDSKITLNGIEYTGSSNSYSINGLNITAQVVTDSDGIAKDENAISITTSTDTQGIYDKIKDFLSQYNSLINEITSLYNADSAKGYEPLTDDEKDAMSDTEVEKWEQKIKDSLLRRDDNLESLMSAMTSAMSGAVEVNGKKMYLSNFGIKTLGYLNAPANQQNAYHIDGDEDDANSSGNADKLMTAITSDPDTVINFMQGLASNLYNSVHKKMQTSSLSSIYTVYNDKEMASEYSDYTDLIKKWEEKLQDKEDYYYKKFSSMETALSKLNSQTSSLSGLFGS